MASGDAANIINSPVNVFWRIEAQTELEFSGSTDDPDALEFNIFEPDGTKVRFIFDLDGVSTIPAAGAGERVVEIDVVTGDSAATRASKAQVVIDGDSAFSATVSSTTVTVTGAAVGRVTNAADVDSGITITTCRTGQDLDLGLLSGTVDPTLDAQNFEVTAHQTGIVTRALLHQGSNIEVTTTLLETTKSKLAELYGVYGSQSFTPGGGTEVFGVGTGAIGTNLLVQAARLEMIPVTSVSAELSYNTNFMLALPIPGTLSFNGEEPRTLEVTWRGFPDTNITSTVDTLLFGDPTQTGL